MNTRVGIAIFLIFAALVGVSYYYGFVRQEPSIEAAQGAVDDKDLPEVLIKGLTISSWAGGARVWEMKADSMELPRFGRNATLTGIKEGTIFRDNVAYLGFSAGRAAVDGRNRMQFSEGVLIMSQGKPLMVTESMVWDPVTQLVNIPGETEITADGSKVTAKNLTVDLKDEYISTTGDIIAQQGDSVKITAGNMRYSVTRREMEIIGPLTITIDL